MAKKLRLPASFYLALIVLVFLVPLYISDPYHMHILIIIGIASIAALGIRLVITTGQWNFGQGGIMAIGAYISVLLVTRHLLPFWLAFPIAGVGAALFAGLIGYPALKIKGAYFGILTLAMGVAIKQLVLLFREYTNGAVGIYNVPGPNPIKMFGQTVEFTSKTPYFYFIAILLAATIIAMVVVERSRFGPIFNAIRQKDNLAESVGINITRYKVLAFVVASLFAGLAGAFSGHYYLLVHPGVFDMWPSIYYVAYAIIGGVGSIFGPILGSLILTVAVEVLRATAAYQAVAYATVLLVVIMFLPRGAISLPWYIGRFAAWLSKGEWKLLPGKMKLGRATQFLFKE